MVENKKTRGLSRAWLIVVVGFGAAAFLVRWAGLTIPVIGTETIIDPREVFVILGAAITGPLGGLVIGFLASLPALSIALGWSSVLAHTVSGCLAGFLYKPIYQRWRMPLLLFAWGALTVAYYYVMLIPTFVGALLLVDPEGIATIFGSNLSFFRACFLLGQAALPEVVITLGFTTLILVALPAKYRRPLW